jgi:uncharacterized protein YigA (DUF484 family)
MSAVRLTLAPHPTMRPLHLHSTDVLSHSSCGHWQPLHLRGRFNEKMGIQSGCALPLTTAHHRRGVLLFGSDEAEGYSQEDICFLSVAP